MKTIEFVPGNGTSYKISVFSSGDKTILIWWLHGAGGQSIQFNGEVPHPGYVEEKLRINRVDAIQVCAAARQLLGQDEVKS